MYNHDIKMAFLTENYSSSSGTFIRKRSSLNVCEETEIKYLKDIAEFNLDELQEALDNSGLVSVRECNLAVGLLKEYNQWRKSKGYTCNDAINEYEYTPGYGFRKHMVDSELDLHRKMDSVFDDPALETMDLIYRAFLWFAFCGIPMREAVKTNIQDVNESKYSVRIEGITYPLVKEALPDISALAQVKKFCVPNKNNDGTPPRYNKRKSEYLFGVRSAQPAPTNVRDRLAKRTKGTDIDHMTYFHVYKSGVFCRIYEREMSGLPYGFDAIAKERALDKGMNPNSDAFVEYIERAKYDLEQDYKLWKQAFNKI